MSTEKTADLSDFTEILKKIVKYKNDYEKLLKEGGLNKELNLNYKNKFSEYDTKIQKVYEDLNIRKNKYTINNYIIELYMRPVNDALTMESIGKMLYKFNYDNRFIIGNDDGEELRKDKTNYLTKLMVKFIENERYKGDKLSIRVIKNNEKDIDYSTEK